MRALLRAGLGLLVAPALAQTPPPAFTFFKSPAMVEAKLSPGGKRVAIRTALGGDRYTVGVIDLDDKLTAYKPAAFREADVIGFNWVSDERLIFNGYDLHDYGGTSGGMGLYATTYDGQRRRVLIESNYHFLSDGSELALPPHHMLLKVPSPQPGVRPDEVVIANVDYSNRELSGLTPMWLDTGRGSTRSMELGENVPRRVRHWWFDSAGNARVAATLEAGRSSYHWRGPQDKGWRRIAEGELLRMPFYIEGVDDAGTLYVVEASGVGGTDVLKRFDFKTGQPEAKALVAVPGFDFRGSLMSRVGGSLAGVRVHADAEATVWFAPKMRELQEAVDARLPNRINRISCARCEEPDMVALVRSYSDRDPGTLYVYEAARKRLRPLLQAMPGIQPEQMARVDMQMIKARDGRDLPVWLTLPRGHKPGQPAPTVVMVHGGPWVRTGHWQWEAMNQFLASRGWLVIEPEFRGSEGYGQEHFRAGWKQWGQAMQDDVADALLWAQDRGLAQKERACIAGASYGGYAALMGPVRHPGLYRCVAAWAGVADLDLYVDGNWWVHDDISDTGRRYSIPQLVGDVKADAAMLRANSPVLLADKMKAPIMLVYGEADRRVPLAHGTRMRSALKDAGNPPLWITYPHEGHGWTRPETQIDFAQKLEAFLAKYLGAAR